MRTRFSFSHFRPGRIVCPGLTAVVWLLLEQPLLRLPGLGDLSWRQIWPKGMPLLEISLVMTALTALLEWMRGLSFFLGAICAIAAFTGVKIHESIRAVTTEIDDPALAQAARDTVDGTVITTAGYALPAVLGLLIFLAFRTPLGRAEKG